jgi:hypothetical protein
MKILGRVFGGRIYRKFITVGGTTKGSLETFILQQGKHVVIGSIRGCRLQFPFLVACISPARRF